MSIPDASIFTFFVNLRDAFIKMSFDVIEYNLVLFGWIIAFLLGTLLLLRSSDEKVHPSYRRAMVTCALVILLLGVEILFQWLIRFYFELNDPVLSVSVYLLAFCIATLLFTAGFCAMMAPALISRSQRMIAFIVVSVYSIFLLINYFVPNRRFQLIGILVACALLFIFTCVCVYKAIVIYRRAINDLRTYYSDFVENLMRWMPGVGVSIMFFLLAAPIACLCPRWVGVNQLALGIIMFIYTFVCTINFSVSYNEVATAFNQPDNQEADHDGSLVTDGSLAGEDRSSLSEALQQVIQDKEVRWRDHGGYRTSGLTIDQAARAMGTNRSYLSRYLNEVRHMTFYEWVAIMRIDEAKSLMLENRDTSIEEIASQVGFSSLSTFSSTFKKVVGESPVKWKNSQKL